MLGRDSGHCGMWRAALGGGCPRSLPPVAALTSVHIDGLLAAVSVGAVPIAVLIIITRRQRVCKGKRVTRDAPVCMMGKSGRAPLGAALGPHPLQRW